MLKQQMDLVTNDTLQNGMNRRGLFFKTKHFASKRRRFKIVLLSANECISLDYNCICAVGASKVQEAFETPQESESTDL